VRLGYAATTNSGGVKKWKKDYDDFFRGADVVVVSDNDANGEGQAHAGSVARRLSRVAKRVRTIIFPVKDLSQWAEASGTREQLDALIETAPEESGTALHADSEVISGGLEDTIALAFAEKHAADLRYVAIWNRWMQYNGAHWEVEQTLGAFDEARKLCRQAEDADAKTVAAVIALARSDRRLAATADQWDADAWLLGTTTGTIDLRTGKLRPASPEDYITKITNVAPGGDCTLWQQFLRRVTSENVELQNFLQRMCGYALTGDTSEDALFFLYGTGANGKSVFLRTVAGILGEHHKAAPMEMFTVSNTDRHPTDLAMLAALGSSPQPKPRKASVGTKPRSKRSPAATASPRVS
jgi:putative DNA primase/helicase